MELYFLAAEEPITKKYELNARGDVVKHPYPFVYRVTSIEERCISLYDMARLLQDHAKKGNTLLKGRLNRQLIQESRAGTTDADQSTDWICLDLDGIDNYQSVDLFLKDIGCEDVDYVLQWSSSMNIENNSGFRCHIFMRLDRPTHPQILKHWLMDLNLRVPTLRAQCELTKTGNALLWPLDITTCQNDKLIYVAPPHLGPGITDPFPGVQRISYHKRNRAELILPKNIPGRDALRTQSDERISELRKEAGLPARKATKYKRAGNVEFMVSPDAAVVTGVKEERGFVYFNLNGGDSWAYYHPEDNPSFIYNFKGEPTYRTEDLLPDYWAKLQQNSANYTPNRSGTIYLAFRDFRTANYYNGSFNTGTNELILAMAKNESQLRQFMKQHGSPLGDYIPDWDIVWDPHSSLIVDTNKRELNMYNPSQFYKSGTFPNIKTAPPTIHKVISHVLGHDGPTISHFYNWLAVIVQNLAPTGTAWVLQGTQGCLAGDTVLDFATPTKYLKPSTVKDAYEKWNGAKGGRHGRGWDVTKGIRTKSVKDGNTIGYHEIFKIVESGVKQLFKLTASNGKSIRITAEHPIMRPDGTFTKLCELNVGDQILMEGAPLEHKEVKGRAKNRNVTHSIPHHPHGWQHMVAGKNYKRMNTARLVVEAHMNGMLLSDYIDVLRNSPEEARTLRYLADDVIVHHLDEDLSNEDLSNLVVIDKLNHDAHHAKETGLGTISTHVAHVVSIEAQSEEMTYDIVMKAPYHNYIADGFAVSNTGKGVLFHQILTPIFGDENVVAKRMEELESEFTGFMENKFVVFIDEIESGRSLYHTKVTAKLKNLIVEPMISIRKMYHPPYMAKNYSNMIFASNKPAAVEVSPDDRRFNVGVYQERGISLTSHEVDVLIPSELLDFYGFLMTYPADPNVARKPLVSEARSTLINIGLSSIEDVLSHIKAGDIEFLWDNLPSRTNEVSPLKELKLRPYRELLKRILNDLPAVLSRDDLYTILEWCVGNMPDTPHKFTSMLKHYRVNLTQVWNGSKNVRGIQVNWDYEQGWLDQVRTQIDF